MAKPLPAACRTLLAPKEAALRAKYAVAREFTAKLFAGRLEAAGKCIGAADGTSSEPAVAKIAEERYFI